MLLPHIIPINPAPKPSTLCCRSLLLLLTTRSPPEFGSPSGFLLPLCLSQPRGTSYAQQPTPFRKAVPASKSPSQSHRLLFCVRFPSSTPSSSSTSSSRLLRDSSRLCARQKQEKNVRGVQEPRQRLLVRAAHGRRTRNDGVWLDPGTASAGRCCPITSVQGAAGLTWGPGMYNKAVTIAHCCSQRAVYLAASG